MNDVGALGCEMYFHEIGFSPMSVLNSASVKKTLHHPDMKYILVAVPIVNSCMCGVTDCHDCHCIYQRKNSISVDSRSDV